MAYERPSFKERYDNFIGGEWVAPVDGVYFDDVSPVDNKLIAQVAKSNSKDVDLAMEAAGKAFETWGKTSATERSTVLNKIADAIEANLEKLAIVESLDNGKAVRETLNAFQPCRGDR